MNKTNEAILKTIIYADIFDYPLTSEELYKFLIVDNPLSLIEFTQALMLIFANGKRINSNNGYYFLQGRDKIVELRKKRERWSQEKLKIAKKAVSWLKSIPWVRVVGVTGSLAMLNADKNDDIDILIVSAGNRIWLTRLLATILMELLGKRRHPGMCHPERSEGSQWDSSLALRMTTIKNKICLNMFLDEKHLSVPKKERDLYSAHEVAQMKPLYDKDNTYQKFLAENLWVKKYLPNASSFVIPAKAGIQATHEKSGFPIRSGMTIFFNFLESIVKNFQLWYMAKRRTTEVVSDGVIRFHPQDARKWVLTRYQDSLKIALIQKE